MGIFQKTKYFYYLYNVGIILKSEVSKLNDKIKKLEDRYYYLENLQNKTKHIQQENLINKH